MKNYLLDFNTKFFGIRRVAFKGKDATFFRYPVQYGLLRAFNLYHQRGAYTHLFINSQYYGLYYLMEEHDEIYQRSRFENGNGNLYKCSRASLNIEVF
jgi:hypothetical protein